MEYELRFMPELTEGRETTRARGVTGYLSTFALVINENGEAVSEVMELAGIRLNMNDTLRFNPHNGKVYWAINATDNSITVYALETSGL